MGETVVSPADEERFRTGLRGAIDRQAASRRRVKQRRNRRRRIVVLALIGVALVVSVVLTRELHWLMGAGLFLSLALLITVNGTRVKDSRDAENKRGWWGPGV
ncbi:hypothetical protein [Amycolatopsis sp. 195334CR]|uniref:hypothetical protein n=1 Tax=Amycolatopsis sp. 195334CR TaxID=2814588 RepID=UPI001A8BF987|nr:hypothetical protein [Amycolatopsis sp. 195334CR]MBN6039023.1 hypothetical protein [Amycolatopsis sp. 195334CR]